jgi:hypothetical protein
MYEQDEQQNHPKIIKTKDQRISTWETTQSSRQLNRSHHQSIQKSMNTQPNIKFSKPGKREQLTRAVDEKSKEKKM